MKNRSKFTVETVTNGGAKVTPEEREALKLHPKFTTYEVE